jgi:hypothetical protein
MNSPPRNASARSPRPLWLRGAWGLPIRALLATLLATRGAHAEERPSSTVEQARDLFKKGVARDAAGDSEGALSYMLQSRALTPTGGNTVNAGYFCKKLGRYDEALDLFEIAVARFPSELSLPNRATIAQDMADLSQKVSVLQLSGNVDGAQIAVDGKIRRDIPDVHRVRVLPGAHTLRLVRNGFTPAETRVVAEAGRSLRVTLELKPIGAWLHVDADGDLATDANVFLDGGIVGSTPWEAAVRPGAHVVSATQGNLGSSPTGVTAVEGKITPVMLHVAELGGEISVKATPASAAIAIDRVEIAHGSWSGRLPSGSHRLLVSEPGYHSSTTEVRVAPAGAPLALNPALIMDLEHARWPRTPRSVWWVSDFVGYALAPSLGSGAEASCARTTCAGHWGAGGPFAGLRIGYELPFKLSFELTGGVARLSAGFRRDIVQTFGGSAHASVTYQLDDHLTLTGPFVALGLSKRFPLGDRVSFVARIGFGALVAWARDPITGFAQGGRQTVTVKVLNSAQLLRHEDYFILPEIGSSVRLGRLDLGAFLAVGAFLTDGPGFDHPSIYQPKASCEPTNPGGAGCAQDSSVLHDEHAFGRFIAFIPRIDVRYSFR